MVLRLLHRDENGDDETRGGDPRMQRPLHARVSEAGDGDAECGQSQDGVGLRKRWHPTINFVQPGDQPPQQTPAVEQADEDRATVGATQQFCTGKAGERNQQCANRDAIQYRHRVVRVVAEHPGDTGKQLQRVAAPAREAPLLTQTKPDQASPFQRKRARGRARAQGQRYA